MPAAMPIVIGNGINQSEQKMLMCIALWMPHYGGLFAAELEHNRALTGTVGMVGANLQPSTYRQRLKGAAAESYDARRVRQERDELAIINCTQITCEFGRRR